MYLRKPKPGKTPFYAARYPIPPDLQRFYGGKKERQKSTGTANRREAERVAARLIDEWEQEFEALRMEIVRKARATREAAERGEIDEEFVSTDALDLILDSWQGDARFPVDEKTRHPKLPTRRAENYVEAAAKILGGDRKLRLLSEFVEEHLEAKSDSINKQTRKARQKALGELVSHLHDPTIASISREMAMDYVRQAVLTLDVSEKTKKDHISHISAVFNDARFLGYIETNPFERLWSSQSLVDTIHQQHFAREVKHVQEERPRGSKEV